LALDVARRHRCAFSPASRQWCARTHLLIASRQYVAAAYALGSLVAGVAAVIVGMAVGRAHPPPPRATMRRAWRREGSVTIYPSAVLLYVA
jgi:hypothetical protein